MLPPLKETDVDVPVLLVKNSFIFLTPSYSCMVWSNFYKYIYVHAHKNIHFIYMHTCIYYTHKFRQREREKEKFGIIFTKTLNQPSEKLILGIQCSVTT